MTKIDKADLENISLIKKELNIKNITTVKIKKGDYEIELSSANNSSGISIAPVSHQEEKLKPKKENIESISNSEDSVKSPMVGVAYLSVDPSSPPYTKVGQHVKQGDTLLLIEAMKTFNEVKAPKSGVIQKIIVLSSQPVEFGDDLVVFE